MTKDEVYTEQLEILAIEAFKSDGFLVVNKRLIQQLGLIPAVLLSNYIDKHVYFKERHPEANGWFYLPHEQIAEQLQLVEFTIRKAKSDLISKGILEVQRKGIPAKEWIKIDFRVLVNEIKALKGLDLSKTKGLDLSKTKGHNIKDTIYKENKIKIKDFFKTIPPKQEWIEEFCQEKEYTQEEINPAAFFDYYESKGWIVGRTKMKDWACAVRNWIRMSNERNKKSKPPFKMFEGTKYKLGKDGLYRSPQGELLAS